MASLYDIIDPDNPMKWRSPKDRENANNIYTALSTNASTTTTTSSSTTTTTSSSTTTTSSSTTTTTTTA